MTTTGEAADGDSPREDHSSPVPGERPPTAPQEPTRHFVLRALLSGDLQVRFGQKLALYGPLAFFALLVIGILSFRTEAEAALGLTMSFWLFIGVVQLLYLIPAMALSFFIGRRRLALGLLQGGGLIAFVNAVAWVIGYYFIGVR